MWPCFSDTSIEQSPFLIRDTVHLQTCLSFRSHTHKRLYLPTFDYFLREMWVNNHINQCLGLSCEEWKKNSLAFHSTGRLIGILMVHSYPHIICVVQSTTLSNQRAKTFHCWSKVPQQKIMIFGWGWWVSNLTVLRCCRLPGHEFHDLKNRRWMTILLGGWTTHVKIIPKICASQLGPSSTGRDENRTYLETTT